MIDQFQQMPKGMQIAMAAMTGTSLLGIAAMIDSRALIIVAIGLVLVVVAIFLWRFYVKWQAKKRARALSGQITENSSAAPNAINDPARRAKLDDLRQNFGKGIERFRTAGKDLYSMPWYVVCGEPGSGKTEAIRHCNVGFPPGLQDEMQGAGGTLNMHWWFTNQAVLLDTAGKLLFQEAPPGTTSEWTEFLTLLRKARPNCPVNGLLLVIPSESLIKDSFDDIQKKAGKIARQLDNIQKTLDVRFPVFVLITKCDLINGFREFFSGIKDPQLQNQITGWSNSDPLDTPFRPEAIEQHLDQVVQRVGRRRLGLLKDPVPADPGARRMDEVDALFALPSSIGALAPRLRKYLETIFVANEWSGKPLFLRGIYFTSALTEGSALDAELASALGLPPESLPEGKAWEKERSFFLRDLFLQKIFKEQGLVTRATNTRGLVRRRQWIIGGVVVCGFSILVILSLLGRNALRSSVGDELAFWSAGARETDWNGAAWHPVVDNGLAYVGNDPVQLEGGVELPVVEFHDKLQKRVAEDLRIPWIFKPIESIAVRANPNRRKAQRVLFEASVITPLVESSRESLLNAKEWTPADVERLAALIELEGAIHLRDLPGYVPDFAGEEFFLPLLGPSIKAVPERDVLQETLIRIFEWTYFRGGAGRGEWPPLRLSKGRSLRDNPALAKGMDSLEAYVQKSQTRQRESFNVIQSGRLTVARHLDAERVFLAAAAAPASGTGWRAAVDSSWRDLVARRAAVDLLMADLKRTTGLTENITLDGGYRATVEKIRTEAGLSSKRIREAMMKQKAAADAAVQASSGAAADFRLYRDLQARLGKLDNQVATLLEQAMPASEQAQLADLDAQALRAAEGVASYSRRFALYAEAVQRLEQSAPPGDSLLGRLGATVGRQSAAIAAARETASKYDGTLRGELTSAHRNLLEAATAAGVVGLLDKYRAEFDAAFPATLGFPLGSGDALSPEAFKSVLAQLHLVATDAADASLPPEAVKGLADRFEAARRLASFGSALLTAKDTTQPARLLVVRDRDQAATMERVLSGGSRKLLPRVYPSLRLAGRDFRVRGLVENVEVGRFALSDALPRFEFSSTPDPKPEPDAQVLVPDGWGVLRLLRQSSNRRAEGLEWDTAVRLQEADGEFILPVTIVLEKPLPPLDQWPQ